MAREIEEILATYNLEALREELNDLCGRAGMPGLEGMSLVVLQAARDIVEKLHYIQSREDGASKYGPDPADYELLEHVSERERELIRALARASNGYQSTLAALNYAAQAVTLDQPDGRKHDLCLAFLEAVGADNADFLDYLARSLGLEVADG